MKRFLFIIAMLLAMLPTFGQSNIVAGEYFIDTDPGTGNGTAVTVPSPALSDSLVLSIPANSVTLGYHVLNYRFRDASGHWGLTSSRNFYVYPPAPALANIVNGEYFIDTDPGLGMGTAVTIASPSTNVTLNLQLSVSSLSQGQHSLHYRFLDAAGRWGESSSQLFYVQPPVAAIPNISYGEYFFDTDPGFGSGTSFSFTPGTNVTTSFSIPAASIPSGFHNLQIRFLDQGGQWSHSDSKMFVKVQPDSISPIVRGEYFFDNDPGVGKAVSFNVSNGSANVTLNASVSTGGIALNNFHKIHYRFQTSDGKWGETSGRDFYLTDAKEKYYTPINKVEFHVDNNVDSARLRVDSLGIIMHGYSSPAGSIKLLDQDAVTKIGRHFVWARGIDFFGTYGKKYNYKEFVVTDDTTKGMLLGQTLNPDSSMLTGGLVLIYKDSLDMLTRVDSFIVDNTGDFLIKDATPGSYLFLLKPDPQFSPTAINTYYNLQPQWQMANFQTVNADTMFADVTIQALKTKDLSGLTSLSGSVFLSATKSRGITISQEHFAGRPMKGASVVLVGKNTKGGPTAPSNVIASTITGDQGEYVFNNVPKGDYNIIIDILGVPLVNYYTISVDTSAAQKPNLNYVVGTAGIEVLGVSLPKTNNILLYPNPSHGEINLLFGNQSGMTSVTIVDMAGRQVFSRNIDVISNSVYTFDLQSLGKGMYNVILSNGNSRAVKKVLIQ